MNDSIGGAAKKFAKGKESLSNVLSGALGCVVRANDSSPSTKGGKTDCQTIVSKDMAGGGADAKQTGDEGELNIVSPAGVGRGKEGNSSTRGACKK